MITAKNEELRSILSQVEKWPVRDRIVLARLILESLETQPRATPGYTAEEVIAQLQMPQPAPSDAECRQILEDELVRKHGP
jgi:hypothetical protein